MMLDTKKRRAVEYRRVSKEEQAQQGLSIPAQGKANLNHVQSRGWELVGTYTDEGISAKTTDRPDFQRMLTDAESGEFDVIVVYNLSRFSRSLVDTILTIRELKQRNVLLVSVTEPFDCTQIWGEMIMIIIAFFAEWYLQNLSADTVKSKRERAEQGKWGGRLPFGYRPRTGWKKDGGDESAVPDEKDRFGYELARDLAKTGDYSYLRIANAMNDAGYRPTRRAGKRTLPLWTPDSVRSMLANRFYLGEVRYKNEWFPGLHEPLISEEDYNLIAQTMRARGRVSALKAHRETRFYLLAGLLKCGTCQSPMRGEFKQNHESGESYREYRYYRCASRWRAIKCVQSPFVRAEVIESAVERRLTGFALHPNWQAHINQVAKSLMGASGSNAQPKAQDPKRIKAQLKRLRELYEMGEFEDDPREYVTKRDALKVQLEISVPKLPAKINKTVATVRDLGEVWTIATDNERQQLVQEIIKTIYVGENGSIEVEFKPDYLPFFN